MPGTCLLTIRVLQARGLPSKDLGKDSSAAAASRVGLDVRGVPGEGLERRKLVASHGWGSASALPASRPSPIPWVSYSSGAACDRRMRTGWTGWEELLTITRSLVLPPAVTPSDCYVTLWLPTASSQRLQTRTVKNSRNPIWNQSFRFRIHSQLKVGQVSAAALLTVPVHCCCPLRAPHTLTLCFSPFYPTPPSCSPLTLFSFQNIVQLQVFDQDLLTSDDPVLSVLFDVGTLQAGEFRRESFPQSPQARLRVGQGMGRCLAGG